jgi:hypothetical protein
MTGLAFILFPRGVKQCIAPAPRSGYTAFQRRRDTVVGRRPRGRATLRLLQAPCLRGAGNFPAENQADRLEGQGKYAICVTKHL